MRNTPLAHHGARGARQRRAARPRGRALESAAPFDPELIRGTTFTKCRCNILRRLAGDDGFEPWSESAVRQAHPSKNARAEAAWRRRRRMARQAAARNARRRSGAGDTSTVPRGTRGARAKRKQAAGTAAGRSHGASDTGKRLPRPEPASGRRGGAEHGGTRTTMRCAAAARTERAAGARGAAVDGQQR